MSDDTSELHSRPLTREEWTLRRADSRLSLPTPWRLPLAGLLSFAAGFSLGVPHGAQTAALRYRAENAHRLPQTHTGWYLYHKSKNYYTARGGLREGMKMGLKISTWTTGFFVIEHAWDTIRGEKDFLNTVVASLTIAGGFSVWNRFPSTTATRMAKSGFKVGVMYGLAQDAVGALSGRRPAYVDFVLRSFGREDLARDKSTIV